MSLLHLSLRRLTLLHQTRGISSSSTSLISPPPSSSSALIVVARAARPLPRKAHGLFNASSFRSWLEQGTPSMRNSWRPSRWMSSGSGSGGGGGAAETAGAASTTASAAGAAGRRAGGGGAGGKGPGSGGAKVPKGPADPHKIIRTLLHYVWPVGQRALRIRVILALGLLVGSKLINIQVPFLFKSAADKLAEATSTTGAGAAASDAGAASSTSTSTSTSPTSTSSSPSSSSSSPRDGGLGTRLTPKDLILAAPFAVLIGYGIARSTAAGFAELRNALFASVAQRAIRLVSKDVFRHLLSLDLRFHLDRQTGALQRVMDRGSRSINFVLTSLVFNVVPTALEIGLVAAIFASQCGWEYALTTLATLVAYIAYTVKIVTWRNDIRKVANKLENEASNRAVDSLLNYESVKYFNNEQAEVARYDATLEGLDKAAIKTQNSLSLLNFGQNVIFSVGLTATMVMASRDILAGHMSVGDLILVNGLLFQLSIPLNFVGMVYREVRQGLVDMDAMFALLDTKANVQELPDAKLLMLPASSSHASPAVQATSSSGGAGVGAAAAAAVPSPPAIRFHNVSFCYNPDREVLHKVSFDVPTGHTVAVVGPSGCGKSTLIRLLYRSFDVQGSPTPHPSNNPTTPDADGTSRVPGIYVHGQDIRTVTLESLRQAIGVVPQDTALFNDTIFNNIAYGVKGAQAPKEKVEAAAAAAHIHDTIVRQFPSGYQTVVGERGLKLSGGEKQRVAIARAMLKDAPILLCDEATSALDTGTELAVMGALRELSANRTTLIIAHRLSTIQGADAIVVLDKGRVVERGTHGDLMAKDGLYASMWRAQARAQQQQQQQKLGTAGIEKEVGRNGGGGASSPPTGSAAAAAA